MQCEFLTALSDGELLTRYTTGEQDAFAELVGRYQPMVLRVCRQVIGTSFEADDAAQQVFLALSIKAEALHDRDSLASWLYRVAWNIASKTRRALKTRTSHESAACDTLPHSSTNPQTEPDTLMVLHEALAEIPDIYRQAIVLHYFCGHTTAEAAAILRCPAGTVAARVSRGLQQLRTQLRDRDLILTAVAIKLILISIMTSGKAAAATAVTTAASPKGGLPRYQPPYRPSFRRTLLRAARTLALLPTSFAFSAWGSRVAFPTRTTTYGWNSSRWSLPASWKSGWFGKLLTALHKKPALACALTAMISAGAGTAARVAIESLAPVEQKTAATSKPADHSKKPGNNDDSDTDDSPHKAEPSAAYSSGATPVPEPASLSVLGCAGLALLGRHRGHPR